MPVYNASDLNKCVDVLRAFGASRIWLFGSALVAGELANDLDLACEGVRHGEFYDAIGRLLDVVGKPVDLVDVSEDSRLNRYIRMHGKVLYEAGTAA